MSSASSLGTRALYTSQLYFYMQAYFRIIKVQVPDHHDKASHTNLLVSAIHIKLCLHYTVVY